ncbi:hypothetical protein [Veillonella montpellierensis]|uniref:hypothetical protein n=1 Tax=Veillonella montpellierensis TaxID=187328 RepID=UPI0023F6C658|nr:hypothetical protein [Veillonella montpellierensis]
MENGELRQEILQRLYSRGYKYIAKDSDSEIYVFIEKPRKRTGYWSGGEAERLYLFPDLLEELQYEDEEPLDIEKELKPIDWANIPKDTRVLVSDDGENWYKRYFKEYRKNDINSFIVYANGRTSWNYNAAEYYKTCKLAEEAKQGGDNSRGDVSW